MSNLTLNLGGEAGAAVALLMHKTGWSADELFGTLLNVAIEHDAQGVLAGPEGLAEPMNGISANAANVLKEGDTVVDPEGNPAKLLDLYMVDGNVAALVTTTVATSANGLKSDAQTQYVWRLADLARG